MKSNKSIYSRMYTLHSYLQTFHDFVKCFAGVHQCISFRFVYPVITTDVHWFALAIDEIFQDLRFSIGEVFGNVGENVLQICSLILLSQLFGPITRQPIMAATIINLSHFPRRILVGGEELPDSHFESL